MREKNIAVLMSLHELDLAERISDKIVCIDNGRVGRVGTPEEIFSGGCISSLYGIPGECFCESSGCAELERPSGIPRVFVISGGGKSAGVFRRLQRQGIPFAAGIIPEISRSPARWQRRCCPVRRSPVFRSHRTCAAGSW